eukprot:746829-Rhodomonas_salina.1
MVAAVQVGDNAAIYRGSAAIYYYAGKAAIYGGDSALSVLTCQCGTLGAGAAPQFQRHHVRR